MFLPNKHESPWYGDKITLVKVSERQTLRWCLLSKLNTHRWHDHIITAANSVCPICVHPKTMLPVIRIKPVEAIWPHQLCSKNNVVAVFLKIWLTSKISPCILGTWNTKSVNDEQKCYKDVLRNTYDHYWKNRNFKGCNGTKTWIQVMFTSLLRFNDDFYVDMKQSTATLFAIWMAKTLHTGHRWMVSC